MLFVGETRYALLGSVQAGQTLGRDDDRTADGGDAQLSDRTYGDAAVLPVDQHEEDVRHGAAVPEQRGVQWRQWRRRGRRRWPRGWQWRRRRRRRGRRAGHERQRERDGTHHVARVSRYDTHEKAQRRRPVQNRVRT